MGLAEELFAESRDKLIEFECDVCNEVFDDPVIVCDSFHIFCRSCTPGVQLPTPNPKCPTCRAPVQIRPDAYLARKIGSFKRVCTITGCTWTGQDLPGHLKNCPFNLVDCPSKCGQKILPAKLPKHASVCPEALVKCERIGNGCQASFPRRRLNNHARTCSKYKCKWSTSPAGCKFVDTFDNTLKHQKFCTPVQQANKQLREQLQASQKECADLRAGTAGPSGRARGKRSRVTIDDDDGDSSSGRPPASRARPTPATLSAPPASRARPTPAMLSVQRERIGHWTGRCPRKG